jgi:hypothetical protein
MADRFARATTSEEVRFPDRIGRGQKVESLKRPTESDFGHGPRIWDAVVRGHGSVKATAFTMGEKDESLIRRQITEGTIRLREFFDADEAALCEFAEYVLDTFKPARKSKREIALEQLPRMMQLFLDAATEDK